jgi:hypothetical protein
MQMFVRFLFKNRFKGNFLRVGRDFLGRGDKFLHVRGVGKGIGVLGGEELVFTTFLGMNGREE